MAGHAIRRPSQPVVHGIPAGLRQTGGILRARGHVGGEVRRPAAGHGRSLRAHPELKAILDQLVETSFKNQSQAWYDEYQLSASGDTSYKWARAFNTIINDKKFMNNEAKGVRLWEDARLFINARNTIAKMYQSLPDYDPRKAIIRENYNQWTLQNSEQWDPTLQMYIKQYFDNDSLKVVE